MTSQAPRATTLAELRASGHRDRTVKDEIRENLVERLRAGDRMTSGVIGYDATVLPDLERALLAGQDVILLGERGQAKTRLVRGLVALLDEAIPTIRDCEINCRPEAPRCAACRGLAAEFGEDLPVVWIGRDRRFAEKLATPDIAVADLIGDIDPIKVASGRVLADEAAIHYGLIPRVNRGIVAINELPDLPERIQVALLNVLEERDVQIRGFLVRLDLDLLVVGTANPDDYTNRGRIISPLKDRFGAQVRTHYPRTVADELAVVATEAVPPPASVAVLVPDFMDQILGELTASLREASEVNHRSGVSVRYTIGAHETMVAGAVRRAAISGEDVAVPRVSDLWAVVPAALGRIEFDLLEEGREEEIVARLLRMAILTVWRDRMVGVDLAGVVDRFDEGFVVDVGADVPATEVMAQFVDGLPGLSDWADRLGVEVTSPELAASVCEFVLEGLHLGRRVNKVFGVTNPDHYRYLS